MELPRGVLPYLNFMLCFSFYRFFSYFRKPGFTSYVPHYIDRLIFFFHRGCSTPILYHIEGMSYCVSNPKLLIGVN